MYSLAIGPTTGSGMRQSIYYAKGILAGGNSVTVTFSQAAASPDIRILEYSGVDTLNPLDVSIGVSGNASIADSGPAAISNANDLIVGANIVNAKNIVAGAPLTARVFTSTNSNIVEDRVVNVAASYNAWTPLISAAPWVMQMVAFKAAVSSSNPAPTVGLITPDNGPTTGGTAVTITGTGFLAGATVSLGGVPATAVLVGSGTSITATTSAHVVAGAVNVVVSNSDGQSGNLSNGYTYTAGTGGGTIKFVQVMAATPQTASMAVAVTYPGVQTGGNLNVVVVGWDDSTSAVSSVTDSGGNGYVLAVGPVTGSGGRESIYYAKNIAGGSNTVTVLFDHAAVYVDVRVLEYSGLDTANPLDAGGTAQAAGTGTSANSGAATVATGNELLVGAGKTSGRFTAAGTGYSSRIITSPDGDIAEDRIVSSGGSYSATAAVTSSNWVMQIVAFQAQQ